MFFIKSSVSLLLLFYLISGCSLLGNNNRYYYVGGVQGYEGGARIYIEGERVASSYPFYAHGHTIKTLSMSLFSVDFKDGRREIKGRKVSEWSGGTERKVYDEILKLQKQFNAARGNADCETQGVIRSGSERVCFYGGAADSEIQSIVSQHKGWQFYAINNEAAFWKFLCDGGGNAACVEGRLRPNLVQIDIYRDNGSLKPLLFDFSQCMRNPKVSFYGGDYLVFVCEKSSEEAFKLVHIDFYGYVKSYDLVEDAVKSGSILNAWLDDEAKIVSFAKVENDRLTISSFDFGGASWKKSVFYIRESKNEITLELEK